MKSVAFHNLGCKVNGYEMDFMQQTLQERGYKIVPFGERADIYIINTCTVTNIADRKSRQMLHRARKMNQEAVVVAVGCYVQMENDSILKDMGIDLAVGNNRKKDLAVILEKYLEKRESYQRSGDKTLQGTTVIDIGKEKEYEAMSLAHTAQHTRAFIKVQDGCNQFCSYCIIPHARGRIRSRKLDDVIREVETLAGNGYREVVLTGIHLSSYGLETGDDFSKSRLPELIRAVAQVPGIWRIRLGSLEPRIITEEFAQALAQSGKLCAHFHLSLQSGCDAVLGRMNRKYTAREYYEKVCILRKHFEHPAVTTDVIVGFPGESDQEFQETCSFVEKTGFYEMHIFKYSRRKGTPAAKMEGQIPEEVKGKRSAELMELGEELSRKYRENYLHKEVEVLFEEEKMINGKRYQIGHTREYIKAAARTDEDLSGQVLTGVLESFLQPDILLFQM